MFYLGGVSLAFFLTLLLLTKRDRSFADNILNGWLLVMTVHLLLFYFSKEHQYPQLLAVDFPFPLLHGPMLYLYTSSLTGNITKWRKAWTHFIPAFAEVIYLIPFFLLPLDERIYIFDHQGEGYEVFNFVRMVANYSSGIVYVVLANQILRKHRNLIVEQFSSTDKINLQWLQYLIYWIGGIWLLVIFASDDWVFIATVLFVLFIGFFGVRQIGIFISPDKMKDSTITNEIIEQEPTVIEVVERRKYQKSGLDENESENLHKELHKLMHEEKLFRQSELSLTELAKKLNTPPNHLSQVINEREGKNFYDFVNTLRIEEFQRLVTSPGSQKYTLMGLANECGFNSKSSFNRYCKKVTGKSPSEFLQNIPE